MYAPYLPAFLTGILLAHANERATPLVLAAIALGLAMTLYITAPGARILVAPLMLAVPFATMVRSRVDTFVGEMSYPLYITHFLMMQVCATAGGGRSRPL